MELTLNHGYLCSEGVQQWGEICLFLDYCSIILLLGGEEEQEWKCDLSDLDDAPVKPNESKSSVPV